MERLMDKHKPCTEQSLPCIQVTLRYSGQLRKAFGAAHESRQVSAECSAQALMLQRARECGAEALAQVLDVQGNPRATTLLFINGEQAAWDQANPIRDGDEITLLSPLAGG